jgi:branched-subunit amino acid aminotransferase/4-amino-4-deoxychorismate lyase
MHRASRLKPSSALFVNLDGRLLPATRAHVNVFDRGLLYGDGLFETLRAYRGKPFQLDVHMARLDSSARFLGIVPPRREWRADIEALLRRNRLMTTDAWVRITITRGVAAPGLLPPVRARPTVIIAAGRIDRSLRQAQNRGVSVILLPFTRNGFLAEHKILNYLPAVLGKVIAARHQAFEALFVTADGHVTEGTVCNVFVWRNDRLVTPPATGILPGITRRIVIEAAIADGYRVAEQPLSTAGLLSADEAFLTSSLAEIVPITAVENQKIATAQVGPRTWRLQQIYRQIVDQALRQHRKN